MSPYDFNETALTKAVGYCRVSSKAQLKKGDGLNSQEARIREYAAMRGYEIEEVFKDNITGSEKVRPAMQALLAHLRKHKREGRIVLVDDMSRFARDIRGHLDLRDLMRTAGARLESPTMKFGDDPDSIFFENIMATVHQHQREKNAEQTRNRQRGRLLNGYWPFISCMGLKHVLMPGQGRVLVRDEPIASIIQEAMEGYASGRFQTQAEVRRFFESQPAFPKTSDGSVRNQLVNDILTKSLYAGYVEGPEGWDVPLRKGRHEGLVTFEVFERIQRRLKGASYSPARADLSVDFPLRGSVVCACCGHPLTSCWSTGKVGTKHPYYMCFRQGCTQYRKSIRRSLIEGEFAELLSQLTPAPSLAEITRAMFKDAWEQRKAQASQIAAGYRKELAKVEAGIARLVDRIVASNADAVVDACERRIAEYERTKLVLAERIESAGQSHGKFEELFELALSFLSNPRKLWESGRFEHQKLVLRMSFSGQLAYAPQTGFRTPETTMPFKLLGGVRADVGGMAEREGFEPPVELPPRRISSAVHSTTLPPLREMEGRVRPVDTRRLMA